MSGVTNGLTGTGRGVFHRERRAWRLRAERPADQPVRGRRSDCRIRLRCLSPSATPTFVNLRVTTSAGATVRGRVVFEGTARRDNGPNGRIRVLPQSTGVGTDHRSRRESTTAPWPTTDRSSSRACAGRCCFASRRGRRGRSKSVSHEGTDITDAPVGPQRSRRPLGPDHRADRQADRRIGAGHRRARSAVERIPGGGPAGESRRVPR